MKTFFKRKLKPVLNDSTNIPVAAASPPPPNRKVTFDDPPPPPQEYLAPQESWSAMAEHDLLLNLGPRERTRQEVLWEIVSSEERYVAELVKLNDTFTSSLLPSRASSPILSHPLDPSFSRAMSPASCSSPTSPHDSVSSLPIAARFSRKSDIPQASNGLGLGIREEDESGEKELPAPPEAAGVASRLRAYHQLTNGRPGKTPSPTGSVPRRSHHSLPPPPRKQPATQPTSFSASHASRMQNHTTESSRSPSGSSSVTQESVDLPDDLQQVLEVLGNGILQGHLALSAALRRRYEGQYPLVRSLADVFIAHSYILREYATYVLHLEKALAQADEALSACDSNQQHLGKRASKRMESTAAAKLGRTLMHLEEVASERGESGLAISLSKPFQRLLKYPLLFQNLLFNTDPSTKEYEATLAMVDEVVHIVRSIEDEKTTTEEREKTRDVLARIEGLEKDRMLVAPKPTRLLVEERPLVDGDHGEVHSMAVKQKKSFRRLSDMLKGGEGDLWVVRFSDVSLLCARTGVTTLPSASTFSRTTSLQDLGARNKFATTARRSQQMKPRNLYKFLKVETWNLEQVTKMEDAVLSKEDISRTRKPSSTPSSPTRRPQPLRTLSQRPATPDSADSRSVMSFAVRGNDQLKPVRAVRSSLPPPQTSTRTRSTPRVTPTPVHEQSAKFAHRLRSPEMSGSASVRVRTSLGPPTAPPRASTATPNKSRATPIANRPPWGSSAAAAARTPKPITTPRTKHLSPSPSEDSGVAGLHRPRASKAPGSRI